MNNRGLVGAQIGMTGANTGLVNQEAGRAGAETGLIKANTTGININNEKSRQALAAGDIVTDPNNNTIVRMPDGTNMLWGDWAAKNFPPTLHQVQAQAKPSIPGKVNAPTPPAATNTQFSQLGDAGKAALAQDSAVLRTSFNSAAGVAQKSQSQTD